ncbi:hypothetical protein M5689_018963 [Euphorbia peplus]|nr:hypothetical protein M5689_018963 [Euphorbia peplus]
MRSRYDEVRDAAIPVYFGGYNQDRSYTVYIEDAWVNWYTIIRQYNDGYVRCIYSEEYDVGCKCNAYILDSSRYNDQLSCTVERAYHSHEDRYGLYADTWENLRKRNPHCSSDDFYRNIGKNRNCYRSCERSCFAESTISTDYATYENDAYADAGYNTNALEDSNLVEDATTQTVEEYEVSYMENVNQTSSQHIDWDESQYHSEHEERVKEQNEELEKWAQQMKELVAEAIQPVLRKLEALKEIDKVPVVKEGIDIVDTRSKINKIPEACIEAMMKVNCSPAKKDDTSESNKYWPPPDQEEGVENCTNHDCDDYSNQNSGVMMKNIFTKNLF